ncbi:hypothetical protein LXL04_039769 [Taraxacum kok-saghyz]
MNGVEAGLHFCNTAEEGDLNWGFPVESTWSVTQKTTARPHVKQPQPRYHISAHLSKAGVSFRDAVSGRENRTTNSNDNIKPPPPPMSVPLIRLSKAPMMESSYENSLTGDLRDIQLLKDLPKLINAEGEIFADIHYGCGLRIILKFHWRMAAEEFLKNEHKWNRWFAWLKFGLIKENITSERLAHVKVVGLPVYLRSTENVATIASRFGRMVEYGGDGWNVADVSVAFITIITQSWKHINEEVQCIFEGEIVNTGVIEHDSTNWIPFEGCDFPESPHNSTGFHDMEHGIGDENSDGESDEEDIDDDREGWDEVIEEETLEEGEIAAEVPETPAMEKHAPTAMEGLEDHIRITPVAFEEPPTFIAFNAHEEHACMGAANNVSIPAITAFPDNTPYRASLDSSRVVGPDPVITYSAKRPAERLNSPDLSLTPPGPFVIGQSSVGPGDPIPAFGNSFIKRRRLAKGTTTPHRNRITPRKISLDPDSPPLSASKLPPLPSSPSPSGPLNDAIA